MWWIGSNERFRDHFPDWQVKYRVERILEEIYEHGRERWAA